jgi:hypothetical protein
MPTKEEALEKSTQLANTLTLHHRRSIRLKGYDYSQAGLYFVTICCQKHECFFGEIIDSEMQLNASGHMISRWCEELSHKFPDIVMDTYIIMPNHFHGIIVNTGTVGADLRVCPDIWGEHNVRADLRVCPDIWG